MRQLLSPWNVFWMPFGIDTELRTSSWCSSCIISHFHCFYVDICLDVVVLRLVTSLMVLPPRVMIWKIIKRNAFNWRSRVLYKSCLLGFAAHWWSLHVPAVLGPSLSVQQPAGCSAAVWNPCHPLVAKRAVDPEQGLMEADPGKNVKSWEAPVGC